MEGTLISSPCALHYERSDGRFGTGHGYAVSQIHQSRIIKKEAGLRHRECNREYPSGAIIAD